MLTIFGLAGLGYLVGSIPAGYIVARLAGVDIRKVGSGNIGATNIVRILGKQYGYPVFVFDFLKGVFAVKLSIFIFYHFGGPTFASPELCGIIGGSCCVLGHSYPVWLGFKGGKGVATSGGVIVAMMPWVALTAGIVWLAVFWLTRYVSVASIAAVLSMPLAAGTMLWFRQLHSVVLFYFSLFLAAIVVVRHRTNLSRLFEGTEQRFHRK
jgi:glycerol-3-phosphate acyltransferase PlsY